MAKAPKLIVAKAGFEIYRAGHVLIIQEGGEFFCNLRKADRGFASPEAWLDELLASRREAEEDRARARAIRTANAAAYLAERAARVDNQFALAL
jgi:hypothetical protein